MNKLIKLFILTATITTVTVIPATLLSSVTEDKHIEQVQTVPKLIFKVPRLTTKYIPQLSSATYIKSRYKEVGCLNSYFKEIKFGEFNNQQTKPDDISDFSSNSQSCLLVEYYKQFYKNDKWWGGLRIIWAVKDETQGFITVTNSRTYGGKLWGNSAAYTLKKDDNSENTWTSSRAKEIRESIKNATGLKNLIPPADSSLPGLSEANKYWGFDPDLKKVCGDKDCEETSGNMIQKSYYWEFSKEGESKPVYSWTSNVDYWLKQIFGWENIKNKIQEVKGKWKEKQ